MTRNKKVAVCLFGQMRTYLQCKDNLDKYILDKLEPDIFIHTWQEAGGTWKENKFDSSSDKIVTEAELDNLYSPEEVVLEEFHQEYYHKIEDVGVPEKKKYIWNWQKGLLPMFYKMWSVNELKNKKEQNEGFKYDLVILLRPDILINEPVPDAVVRNPDCLWARDRRGVEHGMDDQFIISSSANIDYYTSIWRELNEYWETELGDQNGPLGFPPNPDHRHTHMGIPERLVHFHMEQSEIRVSEMELDSHILRREPSKLRKGLEIIKEGGPKDFTRKFLMYLARNI